jgi:hypothetical protein
MQSVTIPQGDAPAIVEVDKKALTFKPFCPIKYNW